MESPFHIGGTMLKIHSESEVCDISIGQGIDGVTLKRGLELPWFVWEAVEKRYEGKGKVLDRKIASLFISLAYGNRGSKEKQKARKMIPIVDKYVEEFWKEADRQSEEYDRQRTAEKEAKKLKETTAAEEAKEEPFLLGFESKDGKMILNLSKGDVVHHSYWINGGVLAALQTDLEDYEDTLREYRGNGYVRPEHRVPLEVVS